jgi:hypothetical protein
MSNGETINGSVVTEEQIEAWAAEAEASYDVAERKKRGRGRPGRGTEPSQAVALCCRSQLASRSAYERPRNLRPSPNDQEYYD